MCRTLAGGGSMWRMILGSALLAGSMGCAALANAPEQSDRPSLRPDGLKAPAAPEAPAATAITASARGSVCGVPEIKGEAIAPIRGRGACGIAQPVRLSSVSGVGLSMKPTIDCPTARALNTWVSKGLKPAVGETGGGVKALHIVGSYACRNRNNARSGRLSEHAKGRAIDIRTIALKNGRQITVLEGWRREEEGRILRRAHAAAGPMRTGSTAIIFILTRRGIALAATAARAV